MVRLNERRLALLQKYLFRMTYPKLSVVMKHRYTKAGNIITGFIL